MTAKTIKYRGCTCTETDITTGEPNRRGRMPRLWTISGAVEKVAGRTPLLTSATACREWITSELDARAAAGTELDAGVEG
jgi:hypothetical protein